MSEIEEIYLQCWHWDGLSVPKEFALLPKTLASLAIVLLKYCSLEQRCFCRIEDFGKDFGKDNIMEEVLSLLDNREDIIPLRLQALQNDGEAMIDLSLRFLTGLDVPFDANSAMRLLIKVVEGRHEDNVRAHAASLACWIAFYDWPGAPEVFQNWSHLGPKMASISCKLGLFSYPVMYWADEMTSGRFPPKRFKAARDASPELMAEFNDFCAEQGWVVGDKRICSGCGKRSRNKKRFVQCAGPCAGARKPVYCDRGCQKTHWEQHRIHCILAVQDDGAGNQFADPSGSVPTPYGSYPGLNELD